jgi:hypothetical protein
MSEIKDLEKRLSEVEKKLNDKTKPLKEKKPRKKTEYNIFVQDFISSEKKKNENLSHKELFAKAAKEWSSKKKDK